MWYGYTSKQWIPNSRRDSTSKPPPRNMHPTYQLIGTECVFVCQVNTGDWEETIDERENNNTIKEREGKRSFLSVNWCMMKETLVSKKINYLREKNHNSTQAKPSNNVVHSKVSWNTSPHKPCLQTMTCLEPEPTWYGVGRQPLQQTDISIERRGEQKNRVREKRRGHQERHDTQDRT